MTQPVSAPDGPDHHGAHAPGMHNYHVPAKPEDLSETDPRPAHHRPHAMVRHHESKDENFTPAKTNPRVSYPRKATWRGNGCLSVVWRKPACIYKLGQVWRTSLLGQPKVVLASLTLTEVSHLSGWTREDDARLVFGVGQREVCVGSHRAYRSMCCIEGPCSTPFTHSIKTHFFAA